MNQYSQFNDVSCYAEFAMKRDIYGLDTLDILENCENSCFYNNCYYLWTNDGYVTVFDDCGNKIDNPDIKRITEHKIPINIRKCVIPDSVIEIGNCAFFCCESLETITIPDSVTKISYSAFNNCESLKSIAIPNSVTEIGNKAFYCCESLKSITIPNSVKEIGNCAFMHCKSLESIIIPDSVTEIGNCAFMHCKSLESIIIPDSVTEIGNEAFYCCESLETITIPKRLKDKFRTTGIVEYSSNLKIQCV